MHSCQHRARQRQARPGLHRWRPPSGSTPGKAVMTGPIQPHPELPEEELVGCVIQAADDDHSESGPLTPPLSSDNPPWPRQSMAATVQPRATSGELFHRIRRSWRNNHETLLRLGEETGLSWGAAAWRGSAPAYAGEIQVGTLGESGLKLCPRTPSTCGSWPCNSASARLQSSSKSAGLGIASLVGMRPLRDMSKVKGMVVFLLFASAHLRANVK